MPPSKPIRFYRRFTSYDYTRGASLFITVSTSPRGRYFGEVREAQMCLSPFGEEVQDSLRKIPELNPGIRLFEHVVMPDHVHFNLRLEPGLHEPLQVLGAAIRGFKAYTTKLFHSLGNSSTLWQQGYHDYLCLGTEIIDAFTRYIRMNPLKWEMQHNHPEFLHIREPLYSSRLDPSSFWRGIGNTALLDAETKIVSARISRRCTAAEVAAAVERLSRAVDQGFVIISDFISGGEHALREMLLNRPDSRFIVVLPNQLEYGYKPDSRFLEPIRQGRCLMIAKGNEEVAFGRTACLDVNAEIKEIALSGAGYYGYWKHGETLLYCANDIRAS